ncbi:MAG: lysylphosphatidylglycerol synthase transmembrane domain-containing protein [candidate division Zixibacteria bacterium]|nr:lysylphosphatidylglycerol synthase transmembrane domain-containing protein [candidate division Zixibacteria bacterium]
MTTRPDTSRVSDTKPNPSRRWLSFGIKIILTLVVVYFAGRQLIVNWDDVVSFKWDINPLLLIGSLVLHLLSLAFFSYVWCVLMSGFGYTVPLKYGFKIGYISNLGRYVPGRIWQVVSMVYLAERLKIDRAVTVASWGIATMFGIPAAFVVGFGTLLLYPDLLLPEIRQKLGSSLYIGGIATMLVSLLFVVVPNKTLQLYNLLLKLLKRPTIQFKLDKAVALKVYFGYFACWILYGFSFWMFVVSITGEAELPLVLGIGAFIIAYQAGYFAIFSPGGIGTRELVLTGALMPFLGPVAAGIAFAARIWNLIAEVIATIIAFRIRFENGQGKS